MVFLPPMGAAAQIHRRGCINIRRPSGSRARASSEGVGDLM